MQQALEHERHMSRLINQLYELAIREHDYPTQVHLQWFIAEQVEEEKVASDIVEQLKMIGERNNALLLLDRELAKRESEMVNESRGLIAEPSLQCVLFQTSERMEQQLTCSECRFIFQDIPEDQLAGNSA
jgi:ferritin-like protein